MSVAERYLLCRAAAYLIAIPALSVLHVWEADGEAPDLAYAAEPDDLRILLNGEGEAPGTAVALETPPGALAILIVDEVKGMASIEAGAFLALPPVFDFARQFFDAACSAPIDGAHPLRLRT
jgi:hypothetical protein